MPSKALPSRDEVFTHLQNVFVDEFDLDADDITMTSHLVEDLDIDSLDAIDLIVNIREYTGKKIEPDSFRNVRRVSDIVDIVHELLAQPEATD